VTSPRTTVLAINGGSSSIRFSVYDETLISRQLSGEIERIGLQGMTMSVIDQTLAIPPGG
jgi:acetate kinase